MSEKDRQKNLLEKQLEELQHVRERNPEIAAAGRLKFLSDAAKLRSAQRRNVRNTPRKIWQFALASLLVVLAIFGGSVGVANAARETIPGEFLYPAKLFVEDIQLAFTPGQQDKITLLMQYTATRVNEMVRLNEDDLTIPARTTERMENHVRQAMVLAAGLDDSSMKLALNQIRARLQEQVSIMEDVGSDGNEIMRQVRQQFQESIQYIDGGIGNLQLFRQQMRFGQEKPVVSTPTVPTATSTVDVPGKGPGEPGGSDDSPGPQQTPVSTPGSGKGPSSPGSLDTPGSDQDKGSGEKRP